MSVTLGSQNRASSSQDAVMEGNDPLTSAARNDGPRQSLSGQNASGQVVEALEVNGEVPQARFGHTITIVSKSKVVLFGGATGDTGKYSMTGETFMYNILNKAWQKLQGKFTGCSSPAVRRRFTNGTWACCSEGSAPVPESGSLLNERGADADGRLRWSHRR